MTNLPTELLRTFITVIDLGNYTRAGEILGRTQPAVSLQIGRLEKAIGSKLIKTSGRRIRLTEEGQLLSIYARQILSLNDEAVARNHTVTKDGVLRVGLPTDYSVVFLQKVLTDFAKLHPDINFKIICALSDNLMDGLRKDELDIIIAMTSENVSEFLIRPWSERPIWVAAKNLEISLDEPVPLIAHPEGCEYRNRMIQALNTQMRPWRMAFCSPGINGVQNAVTSGLGVSAMTKCTLTDEMRVLTEEEGFPQLASIRVGLFQKQFRQNGAGHLLVNHFVSCLDQAVRS